MNNFKPGDKAIHIGAGEIRPGTEVVILEAGPFERHGIIDSQSGVRNKKPCDYLCKVPEFGVNIFTIEPHLRKPDTYDITAANRHTCPFHQRNPGEPYAGCTCSGAYSIRRKPISEVEGETGE